MLNDSPEARCLLLALRPVLLEAERQELSQAVAGGLDWTALVEMALAHGVTGPLERGLRGSCADLLPPDLAEALTLHRSRLNAHNEALAAELLRLLEALAQAGLEVLPLKGPTQAMQIYGDLSLRSFRDLDLLIHWRDRARVGEVLRGLGYRDTAAHLGAWRRRALQRCNGQEMHYSETAEIAVEPHWDLFPNTFALDFDLEGLRRRAGAVRLLDREVRSLSPEDMVLVACLHGAKEQWWRLNWICDIAQCLAPGTSAAISWDLAVSLARAQHCLRALLLGARLANRLFGVALPEELARALAVDRPKVQLLEEITVRKLRLADPGEPESFSRLSRLRFELHEGPWRKAGYVWRTLFAPRPAHVTLMALPPLGEPAYYLVRAIHDYCLLPVWRSWQALRPSRAR